MAVRETKPRAHKPAKVGGGTAPVRPRLVFFHSRASGRARRVDGYVANVLQRRRNHETFLFQRVIVEEHPELAARFGVDGVPTLFVIEDNRVRARIDNPRGTHDLEQLLAPWLKQAPRGPAAA
jgi:thioredoxin-like negative regulator of GroEL